MVIFENAGRENLQEVVRLAVDRAMELDCDIVTASTFGSTAEALMDRVEECGFRNKVVVVRGCGNKFRKGVNVMTPEDKAALEARGAAIVTAGHALSAGERGLSQSFKGVYPLEIMAATLRTFGQGVKVAFECAVMALEADQLSFGKPVVAIGGTGRGADAAIVITPCYSAAILDTVVHEIICKAWDITAKNPAQTDWSNPKK